ncbi:MAG: hypothetical protein WBG50_25440 [Desulfomonilaceae bacterium]
MTAWLLSCVKSEGITNLNRLKYHHIGIPSKRHRAGEEYFPEHKIYHSGFYSNEFGIEWMYYEDDCELPEIVKTMPHVAFEVEDVYEAIKGRSVIIEPNSSSAGIVVAFIEQEGIPIEFIQTGDDNTRLRSRGLRGTCTAGTLVFGCVAYDRNCVPCSHHGWLEKSATEADCRRS